jgi:hypothetical protein
LRTREMDIPTHHRIMTVANLNAADRDRRLHRRGPVLANAACPETLRRPAP